MTHRLSVMSVGEIHIMKFNKVLSPLFRKDHFIFSVMHKDSGLYPKKVEYIFIRIDFKAVLTVELSPTAWEFSNTNLIFRSRTYQRSTK